MRDIEYLSRDKAIITTKALRLVPLARIIAVYPHQDDVVQNAVVGFIRPDHCLYSTHTQFVCRLILGRLCIAITHSEPSFRTKARSRPSKIVMLHYADDVLSVVVELPIAGQAGFLPP
jgi:hypothetical protein